MQPTHVKWEQLPTPTRNPENSTHPTVNGTSHLSKPLTNGHSSHRSYSLQETPNIIDLTALAPDTIFPPIKRSFANNFLTIDTRYRSAPFSNLGVPGPDSDIYDIAPKGLNEVSDEIFAELPEECKTAFLNARGEEQAWRESWGTEGEDGARARLVISFTSGV